MKQAKQRRLISQIQKVKSETVYSKGKENGTQILKSYAHHGLYTSSTKLSHFIPPLAF